MAESRTTSVAPPAILARLQTFLPEIQQANQALDAEFAAQGDAARRAHQIDQDIEPAAGAPEGSDDGEDDAEDGEDDAEDGLVARIAPTDEAERPAKIARRAPPDAARHDANATMVQLVRARARARNVPSRRAAGPESAFSQFERVPSPPQDLTLGVQDEELISAIRGDELEDDEAPSGTAPSAATSAGGVHAIDGGESDDEGDARSAGAQAVKRMLDSKPAKVAQTTATRPKPVIEEI